MSRTRSWSAVNRNVVGTHVDSARNQNHVPLTSTHGELRHTRLLRDLCSSAGPGSGFPDLLLEFLAFLNKTLSLKNVKHALCKAGKYFRSA